MQQMNTSLLCSGGGSYTIPTRRYEVPCSSCVGWVARLNRGALESGRDILGFEKVAQRIVNCFKNVCHVNWCDRETIRFWIDPWCLTPPPPPQVSIPSYFSQLRIAMTQFSANGGTVAGAQGLSSGSVTRCKKSLEVDFLRSHADEPNPFRDTWQWR